MTSPPGLPDWLLDPALAPVWTALRRPVERRQVRARIDLPDAAGRHALSGLLGRHVAGPVTVELVALDSMLHDRTGLGLREIVAATTGPLRDPSAERAAAAVRRTEPIERLAAGAEALDRPWVASWIDGVRAAGLLTREASWERLCDDGVGVIAAVLSAPGPLSRTELAARVTGDAHALDVGRPLTALVLRALAWETGRAAPRTAEQRAQVWETAGVLRDLVSQTVLTLGLRGRGPRHLTAWELRETPLLIAASTPVLVCENPAVLEAFATAGLGPVVCGRGWPSLLVLQALDQLRACGAELRYHGDFDWPGLSIASWLVERCGVAPWLMTSSDYRTAASGAGLTLTGAPIEATWDPDLRTAMHQCGTALHEESVLSTLTDAWGRTT